MLLRLCFAIIALFSIFFTIYFLHENRINDKISLGIIIFEILVFVAVEYHIWE